MVARSVNLGRNKVAGLLGFLAGRFGDAQIDKECLERMKEGQSDIYYVTGETTIAPMCPSDPLIAQPSMVALRKHGLVVTYSVDPLSGWAMQLLHEVPGTDQPLSGWAMDLGRMLGRGAPCFTRPVDIGEGH